MVWYFIGVYIINKTWRGRLEIRNFSFRVEKIPHSFAYLCAAMWYPLIIQNSATETFVSHDDVNCLGAINCCFCSRTAQLFANLKDSVAIFKKEIERLSKNAIQNAIIAWFRHFTSKYLFSSSFQLLDWTKEPYDGHVFSTNQIWFSFFFGFFQNFVVISADQKDCSTWERDTCNLFWNNTR